MQGHHADQSTTDSGLAEQRLSPGHGMECQAPRGHREHSRWQLTNPPVQVAETPRSDPVIHGEGLSS